MSNVQVFLTNLSKYNEGELIGQWVSLPQEEETLVSIVSDVLGNDEEYFITDFENLPETMLGEHQNIYELNSAINGIDEYDEIEKAVFFFLLDYHPYEDVQSIIDSGNFTIYENCRNMSDVAMEVVEKCGYLQNETDFLVRYFDYDAFGRDLEMEGNLMQFTHDSYLEVRR